MEFLFRPIEETDPISDIARSRVIVDRLKRQEIVLFEAKANVGKSIFYCKDNQQKSEKELDK